MGPSSAGSGFGDLIWSCLRLADWASSVKDIVRSLSVPKYIQEHPDDPWPMKRGKRKSICNLILRGVDFESPRSNWYGGRFTVS